MKAGKVCFKKNILSLYSLLSSNSNIKFNNDLYRWETKLLYFKKNPHIYSNIVLYFQMEDLTTPTIVNHFAFWFKDCRKYGFGIHFNNLNDGLHEYSINISELSKVKTNI